MTPGICPCNASDTELTLPTFRRSSPLVDVIDPTLEAFFCTPYPTTTTSSSVSESSRNLIIPKSYLPVNLISNGL